MTRALFIGRFQPFHKGHLAAIKYIEKKADSIIICLAAHVPDENNPFSIGERKKMIRDCGISHRIEVIKDTDSDEAWSDMIIRRFHPDMIFSNNPWTQGCFAGKFVKVLKIPVTYRINATIIRRLMKEHKDWKRHVPIPVVKVVEKHAYHKADS